MSGQSLAAFATSQLVHELAILVQTVAHAAAVFVFEAVAETVVDHPVPTDSAVAAAASAPTKSAAFVFEVYLVAPSQAAAVEQIAAFSVEIALVDLAHACRGAAAVRTEQRQTAENPKNLSIDGWVPRSCVMCYVSARSRKDDLCQ